MKNSIIIFALFIFSLTTNAQSYDGWGDQKLNVGYDIYGYGTGVKVSYDHGLSDLFSIGAGASYYFNNDENDYFLYGRANLHFGELFDLPSRLDIYPGIELGFLSCNYIGISGYVGIRYFITKKIGLFAELGSNGAAGISFDF